MKLPIILFCAIVLLLLTAVLPIRGGLSATAIYYSPVFIVLLALLSGCTLWCCRKRRSIGFYLMHLGVVAILVGAFVGYIAGVKGMLQLALLPPRPVNQLVMEAGDPVPLGFDVSADEFTVKFYPPIYHLYRQLPPEQVVPGQMPFEQVGEFDAAGQDVWDLPGIGPFSVSSLWNSVRDDWAPRRPLDAGSFLYRASQTPRHYGVLLTIHDGDAELELPVSINHPAGYKGWRFYLMSYDQNNRAYVVVSARRDPGRNTVIAGIWVTMVGAFVLGFRRTKGGAK